MQGDAGCPHKQAAAQQTTSMAQYPEFLLCKDMICVRSERDCFSGIYASLAVFCRSLTSPVPSFQSPATAALTIPASFFQYFYAMNISLLLCLFLQVTFLHFFLSFISTIFPTSFWSFTAFVFSPGTVLTLYMHFNWIN